MTKQPNLLVHAYRSLLSEQTECGKPCYEDGGSIYETRPADNPNVTCPACKVRSVAEALEAALADVATSAAAQGASGARAAAAMQRVRDLFFSYVGRVREQAYEDGRAVERVACAAKREGTP